MIFYNLILAYTHVQTSDQTISKIWGFDDNTNFLVSIHALARRATIDLAPRQSSASGFNPRAREERDDPWISQFYDIGEFQSTRSRGARLLKGNDPVKTSEFQSTRSRGARRKFRASRRPSPLFQSTRSRGARQDAEGFPILEPLFQSTRSRGARQGRNRG